MPLIVGSVGTPRISGPVGIAAGRGAFFFDNSPFYGFVTTSAEALQQFRHALGVLEIPGGLARLMAADGQLSTDLTFALPHDLLFVEITSRKLLSVRGLHLQIGTASRFFLDRPSLAEALVRFWGPDAIELRLAFLADDPAFVAASPDERQVLSETAAVLLSDDEILLDLRRMHSLVGDRLVIVTPCLDEVASDATKRHHAELIALLKTAAGQLGLPVLDPSAAMAEVRAEFGDGEEEDAGLVMAAFESHLAGVLRREYLDPLRRRQRHGLAAAELLEREPRTAWPGPLLGHVRGWLDSRRRLSRTGGDDPDAALDDEGVAGEALAPRRQEAAESAWFGDWRGVLDITRGWTPVADDCELLERIATAQWYVGATRDALAIWRIRLARPAPPLRLIEAAELALQAGDVEQAGRWVMAAASADPSTVIAAMRILMAHGAAAEIRCLLETGAGGHGAITSLLPQLAGMAELKRFAVELAWQREEIDLAHPEMQALLRDWLNSLLLDQRAGRVEAVRHGAARLDALPDGHPARQTARRLLLRALHGELRQTAIDRAEALAEEIRGIDPAHIEAVTILVRLRHQRGERRPAALLADSLARAHPQAPAVQFNAIRYWISAGDLVAAAAALRRCKGVAAEGNDFAALRLRLHALIQRDLRQRRATSDPATTAELQSCLAGLSAAPDSGGSAAEPGSAVAGSEPV